MRLTRGTAALLALVAPLLLAQNEAPKTDLGADAPGAIVVPRFVLPFSDYASPEARADFIERRKEQAARVRDAAAQPKGTPSGKNRSGNEAWVDRALAAQLRKYPATMTESYIGGVHVRTFVPAGGVSKKNANRLLINLHGGGFTENWDAGSRIESLPLASIGRVKVISVDYRMAPKFHFPAASEDVASVYRALLKTYRPSSIAVYGCSAGGVLGPQAIAYFQKAGLPMPAALGILSGSLTRITGDSIFEAAPLAGYAPSKTDPDALLTAATGGYFNGVSATDPLMWPAASDQVLKRFPPTMLATGVRGVEMSATVQSHLDLVRAGVDARLFLWEGVGHCFMYNPNLPESDQFYHAATRFFLGAMKK